MLRAFHDRGHLPVRASNSRDWLHRLLPRCRIVLVAVACVGDMKLTTTRCNFHVEAQHRLKHRTVMADLPTFCWQNLSPSRLAVFPVNTTHGMWWVLAHILHDCTAFTPETTGSGDH